MGKQTIMTVYLNYRSTQGVETTVDEFTRGDNAPAGIREFNAYVREMMADYHVSGIPVYRSSRPCKEWPNGA